jgi:membrane associated rhomboid family serine protease
MLSVCTAVSTQSPSFLTWILIGANCAVLSQLSRNSAELDGSLAELALIPARYRGPSLFGQPGLSRADFIPFFTMMFLHDHGVPVRRLASSDLQHMETPAPRAGNRGSAGSRPPSRLVNGVRRRFGHRACGDQSSVHAALDASGATAGVLGCYVLMFALARVIVVIHISFIPLFFELYAGT